MVSWRDNHEKRFGMRLTVSLGLGILFLGMGGCSSDTDSPSGGGGQAKFSATIVGGGEVLPGFEVVLFQAGVQEEAIQLGRGTSGEDGMVSFDYAFPVDENAILYSTAEGPAQGGALAETAKPVLLSVVMRPDQALLAVVVNERTTVAMAFATAQFLDQGDLRGPFPGLQNAADIASVLVNPATGLTTYRLHNSPNGDETRTEKTFNSLANLLGLCSSAQSECDTLFFNANSAYVSEASRATDTLQAVLNIAHYPSSNLAEIASQLVSTTPLYDPALSNDDLNDLTAWTLALRYVSESDGFNGPANVIFDAEGNGWIANNLAYGATDEDSVCGGRAVFKMTPTGQNYFTSLTDLSPYDGGGLYGAGYGITLDPSNHVWVGNFGFQGKSCGENSDDALDMSVSEFDADTGEPLSPSADTADPDAYGGWSGDGTISLPQGTYSDRSGNIWVANCGGDSITRFNRGDPQNSDSFTAQDGTGEVILYNPFDLAIDPDGHVWATSNNCDTKEYGGRQGPGRGCADETQNNGSVHQFNSAGDVIYSLVDERASLSGISYPIGIASDSAGNIWVANSGLIPLPCSEVGQVGSTEDSQWNTIFALTDYGDPDYDFPGRFSLDDVQASVTLIESGSTTGVHRSFTGGGIQLPWGINVDGNDNVWVANFDGQRLTHLCGARPETCPPGFELGQAISPPGGYTFDGLTRNTNVSVDPSGNLWLSNNWKTIPAQGNPGGHELVVFIGLAAPVVTPQLGAPSGY